MVPMRKQPTPRAREKDPKLTLSELTSVWNGTLKDPTARSALDQLKREGFNILHLSPQDPTFHHPSWADYIAAIPLLDNRPSRSHFHRKASLRKHLPLVSALRHFARQFDDVVNEIRVIRTGDTATGPLNSLPELADRTASFIEKFLSWDWYVRERNPRNALIAELRWTIRPARASRMTESFPRLSTQHVARLAVRNSAWTIPPWTELKKGRRKAESNVSDA